MICCNCGSNDWKDVDQYRFKDKDDKGKKIGMAMCNSCGMISYPSKYQSKEEIIAHYRKEYRKPPSVINMFTGQRKNHFHMAFLKEYLENWNKSKEEVNIVEIGAAFGLSLNLFQQVLPKANIEGTELTTSYKNVCYHEFGIKLQDDFDDTKKYDLIMSYKVLEHQLDPHLELKRYSEALKPEGFLYISVPLWLDSMVNFGLDGFDLDYYYEPNHINVWTREIFENIMLRAGLEIVKEDHTMYGDTYLCKKSSKHSSLKPIKLKTKEVLEKLEKIQKAFELFREQKYDLAIAVWPDFPQAHISNIEMKRKELSTIGYEEFKIKYIEPMLKACPNSVECIISHTDIAMRMKKFDEAIELTKKALDLKPNNPVSLHQAATIYEQSAVHAKEDEKKKDYLLKARSIWFHVMSVSEQNKHEAISKIYFINAHLGAD